MEITGLEVKLEVLAVKVFPNTALPVMETVPERLARSVEKEADGLSADAKCVSVSALRCVNVYKVFGINPLNTGDDCHAPPLMRYSQPETVTSVMLVGVLLAIVGVAGVSWVAFVTAAVLADVTLPVQFATDTTTFI